MMTEAIPKDSPYLSDFARLEPHLARRGPLWLQRLRRLALTRFRELGFPAPQDEAWRHTSVSPILRTAFRPAGREEAARPVDLAAAPDLPGTRLVFVNGRHVPDLSPRGRLPRGVLAGSLAEALFAHPERVERHLARHASHEERVFTALNTVFLEDGGLVIVPSGAVLEEPIHLVYVSVPEGQPTVSYPRTLVLVGDNCQVGLVETYLGPEGEVYFTNAVSEIVLGENSFVDHYRLQQESEAAFHVATVQFHQSRSSSLLSHNLSLGASLARHDLGSVLDAEGAGCILNGLYLVRGEQHVDNHTILDHARPRCTSFELYKGILAGKAQGVFNGKIVVRRGAQKTDAKQSNRNLLLTDDAMIHTRPQLEIYADDVKCTHGATIGHLEEDALFYLRARGIDREEARNLLIRGFASEILGSMRLGAMRDHLEREIAARLPQKGEA